MIIINWLAKAEGNGGLVSVKEIASGNVRLYGNVYGHPKFDDGEYVQTTIVKSFDGVKAITESSEEFTLLKEARVYSNYLNAMRNGTLVLKTWSVENGLLRGKGLDGANVIGKVVAQNFTSNICVFANGLRVFVDWLSKDPNFVPKTGPEELLVFGTERCMPDIFCKHYSMFKRK